MSGPVTGGKIGDARSFVFLECFGWSYFIGKTKVFRKPIVSEFIFSAVYSSKARDKRYFSGCITYQERRLPISL